MICSNSSRKLLEQWDLGCVNSRLSEMDLGYAWGLKPLFRCLFLVCELCGPQVPLEVFGVAVHSTFSGPKYPTGQGTAQATLSEP